MTTTTATVSQLDFSQFDRDLFGSLLDRNGYVYMPGAPADFDYVAFFRGYGDLMPQYDGELVWSVRPHARFDNMYHSLNTRSLMPHTECYEFPGDSPRYLGLWCVVPASDSGGQTTLADSAPLLAQLSPAELEQLASRRYVFESANGVQDMQLGKVATHPLYERRDGGAPIFRFSYNCVRHEDDPFLLGFRDRVVEYFDRTRVAVDMAPCSLLLWDNHRVLHARTEFTDRRRHLRRVWLAG